ncbi:MAG: DUF1800 family protein [Planctomycetales bacterium]
MSLKLLAPWEPDDTHPFDSDAAAHLLRRAGFGASPGEIAAAVDRGLMDTLDELFAEAPDEDQAFQATFDAINGKLLNGADPTLAQGWWIYRMVNTRVPLREKLTLFWHGHFATSFNKVADSQLMMRQIDTLREHAWGSFRDLVLAMARDPAMLVWLDGESNTKAHPNENFARELMELFTCGIGTYTEQDVLESARAFTGWHRNGVQFVFNPEEHDAGPKRILGRRGRFDGSDVIDLLLAQPATSRFIARKLLRFFAAPDPSDQVVAEAAELFDRTQLNVKLFLKELFQSQYFFSEECRRARISSPAEFVVGLVRTLGVRQAAFDLAPQLTQMGQALLMPPSVKGWDGEEQWINSTSLAARLSFANGIAELNAGDNPFQAHCPVEQFVSPEISSPEAVVDILAELLFQKALAEETRQELITFAVTNEEEGPQPAMFHNDEGFRALKTRQLLGVMLSLPEYQAY